MLRRIRYLRIRHQFLLTMVLSLLFGLVADIGLYEIDKTAEYQRLVREHTGYLGICMLLSQDLESIKDPVKNTKEIEDILFRESHLSAEMGFAQILRELEEVTESFNNSVNLIERFMFQAFGFGELFKIAEYHSDDIKMMQRSLEQYKSNSIPYGQFVEILKSNTEMLREDDDIFSETVNSLSSFTSAAMIIMVTISLVLIAVIGWYIYRKMMIQLNDAKSDIQTSSQELQASSQQQLKSASSQTTAVTEIGSVMQQLVATSRQVSDTSSKATSLAKETNAAVNEGHLSLDRALEGIRKIKEKAEVSASNMLSLGEKSQQIGVVLDVINELSQQVTVLSYNATIEAAGAGEMGKRFMAVADRIIKLAERSVESAKEVKSIIDDIQTDSNKTIMSTEDSMKAVEEGIGNSMEVKLALDRINEFMKQVMSAVDEINLSLNQEKTGIEQAASEVDDITVLVRETEDSSRQVMETASQLLRMAEMLEKV